LPTTQKLAAKTRGLGFAEKAAMPKGPRGEKRPADVIGAAVMVAKIATGEIQEGGSSTVQKRASDTANRYSLGNQRRDPRSRGVG
jgi:hypothetical protein